MRKIKSKDEVVVIAGKCKGQRGKVVKMLASGEKVIVEGINLVKKHVKANPNKGVDGGIVQQEAAIHISNVAIFNPLTQKADKVKIKLLEDGKKVRVFKSNDEVIDVIKG